MSLRSLSAFLMLTLALPLARVPGQVIVIDRRPHVPIARTFEVREVSIDAKVRDQVAEVRVSQTFHNPGSTQMESEFLFPIPEDGAVEDFVLMVDGRELPGRLLDKDEARRIYEDIVRSKRDPALLEYMGRGLFRTSVFPIPPGADRTVTLRYTHVLKRDGSVVEFSYPFGTQKFTAKPIRRLALNVDITSREPIKSFYSPSHETTFKTIDDHHAAIRLEQRDVIPATDFRAVYTLEDGDLGATVLSTRPSAGEDGYFLLLASPKFRRPDERPRPKTVLFVLDRSGSMAGKKIEQARKSLQFVLDNLREDDLFNIIAYDDRVETFKPELQRYRPEARAEASRFVENLRPGGSTNIDGALRAALEMLKDDERPNYVLFLTDGLPTAGETKETAIAERAREANKVHARIFSFGVGFDVNARLLDRLSAGNSGASEYVKPDEDIEAKVSRFFTKLTSPVLASLRIEFSGTDVNRTYPRDVPDLFEGGQLLLVGRYRESGKSTVRISGKVGGERQSFEFPAELAEPGRGASYDFVEKLWAVRRVGFILDQIDLHGENRELTSELVDLSKKYGILTPYTSFLADERTDLTAGVQLRQEAEARLHAFREAGGARGVGQRDAKAGYLAAERLATSDGYSSMMGGALTDGSVVARRSRAGGGFGGMGGMGGGMGGTGGGRGRMMEAAVGRGGQAPVAARPESAATAAASAPAAPVPAQNYAITGPAQGTPVLAKDLEGREQLVETVRSVGKKTFYFRNNRWVDAEVKPEDEAKAVAIVQFSDAYFKLAESQAPEFNQYLTFTEPVTVSLKGQVYRIDPPKPE
jgi:Ca-activated chloride channel family protein